MPILANHLDAAKLELRNAAIHNLSAAPSSPVKGQLYMNTTDNTLYWWDGAVWQSGKGGTAPDATTTSKGIIQLAGDLAGTAASPQIAAGVITDVEVAAANKDGAAAVPSMRTLGSGANQAAPGNDSRFTDSRPPNGAAGGDLSGTYPNPAIATGVIIDTDVNPTYRDGTAATASLRTLGSGAQQALAGNTPLNSIAVPTADVSLNSRKITNLAAPIAATDAANKGYVDGAIQGLEAKASVRLASTANVVIATGGLQTIDGVVTVAGDRVLLKNQAQPQENGIYTVNAGAWTRAGDADAWAELVSAYVWVEIGSTQADTGWLSTADQGGTLNTTAVPWVQFSGAGQVVSGAGLTKTGNTLDVGAGTGITVGADTVGLTIPVALTSGGTGQTTAKAARETGLAAAGYYSTATHGAGTTITITAATHGLRATQGLIVQVQDVATGAVELPDISVANTGDVTVTFAASQAANSQRVTIIG